jgi:hypothetical protein
MAFRKLMERTGLFSPKGEKRPAETPPAETPERQEVSPTLVSQSAAARPLSINVDDTSSVDVPIATPVLSSATTSKSKTPVNRDWLTNIRRIKSSRYYNGINDITEALRIISKSKAGEEKLTPSERSQLHDFEYPRSPLSCLSPRSTGAEFEFLQQPSPLKSGSPTGSGIISDYFTLAFGDGSPRQVDVRTDFYVTRHANVVVVETEKSFKNAVLFQKLYPEAAKSFGFMRVIWVDPEKKIEMARSDHPETLTEGLSSHRYR